ncbi:hypothetical protein D3C71_1809380 [compost metagenome]
MTFSQVTGIWESGNSETILAILRAISSVRISLRPNLLACSLISDVLTIIRLVVIANGREQRTLIL